MPRFLNFRAAFVTRANADKTPTKVIYGDSDESKDLQSSTHSYLDAWEQASSSSSRVSAILEGIKGCEAEWDRSSSIYFHRHIRLAQHSRACWSKLQQRCSISVFQYLQYLVRMTIVKPSKLQLLLCTVLYCRQTYSVRWVQNYLILHGARQRAGWDMLERKYVAVYII